MWNRKNVHHLEVAYEKPQENHARRHKIWRGSGSGSNDSTTTTVSGDEHLSSVQFSCTLARSVCYIPALLSSLTAASLPSDTRYQIPYIRYTFHFLLAMLVVSCTHRISATYLSIYLNICLYVAR